MSKSSANAEPSMEEILASIRQIISDEDPVEAQAEDEALDDEMAAGAASETISEADLDALFADPAPAEPDEADDDGSDDMSDAMDDGFAAIEADSELDDDDEDVLDLSALPDIAEDPFDPPEDLDFADPEPVVAPAPKPAPFRAAPDPVIHKPLPASAPLLSQQTDSAVSAAFADLASTMLSGSARTLEDLVQDMLRPMLKSWLDENLPTMVEKMVREEIERVARRGPRS